jgi:Capsule polysaccharide biosynthesis protein
MSAPARIIWLYHSYLANLVSPAARRLRTEHGIETILVCYNRSSLPVPGRHNFDPADFEEIFELDPCLTVDPAVGPSSLSDLSERAERIERRYGISLMEAIRTDRLVGIDFVVGAWFPKSRYGRRLDYPKSVAVTVAVAEAIEALLDRVDPFALVGVSSALGPAILWRMAMTRKIPTRNLVIARSGAGLFWTEEDYMRPMGLNEAFAKYVHELGREATFETVTEPKWMPAPYRAQMAILEVQKQAGLASLMRQLVVAARARAVQAVRGRDRVYGGYLLGDQLRLILNRWRWRRKIVREPAAFAELPPRTPYVFFPLQVEPEATLMFESPMCDNALTAIDWLAKTMPAGWLLVVKEHPGATAPRPRGFWQQIGRYPNVLVAGTLEDGESIVRLARAVAVLNSSLGLQAAGLGKPVITFHPAFVGAMLGHVQVVDSYGSTLAALRRIRDDRLPPMSRRILEANALFKALDACQFPATDPQILSGVARERPIDSADVVAIVDRLMGGLPRPAQWLASAR